MKGCFVTLFYLALLEFCWPQAGFSPAPHWVIAVRRDYRLAAFHLFEQPRQAPKTVGVHASFPAFVRVAYLWLLMAVQPRHLQRIF